MLLSYVNTKLRDNFSSLDELCASLDVNRGDLESKLKSAGFEYNDSLNKFW